MSGEHGGSSENTAAPQGAEARKPEHLVPSPVRIIGTGLIGGSLGLALSADGVQVQVQDASPGTTALAVEMGVGQDAAASTEAPALVLVAAPPDVTAQLVHEALREWPEAIVADVASVKGTVLEQLRSLARPEDLPRYIGAHPMAGREVSGVIAARGDLFRGRPFVVVPHERTEPRAVSLLKALATQIGSVPTVLDASAHDLAVARISHVPQILSSLLASTLCEASEQALSLAGQGLRDTTRIADSDPRLWVEILGQNAAAIDTILEQVEQQLQRTRGALGILSGAAPSEGSPRRVLAHLIADGNQGVHRIPGKHGGAGDDFATLIVLVPDAPGELARLLTEIGEAGVNLEDLRLEHTLGRRVGLAHVSVQRGREDRLTQALTERGWHVEQG